MHPEMSTIPAMRPTANIVNFPLPGLAVGAGVVGDLVGRSVVGACDGDADGENVGVGALAATAAVDGTNVGGGVGGVEGGNDDVGPRVPLCPAGWLFIWKP